MKGLGVMPPFLSSTDLFSSWLDSLRPPPLELVSVLEGFCTSLVIIPTDPLARNY